MVDSCCERTSHFKLCQRGINRTVLLYPFGSKRNGINLRKNNATETLESFPVVVVVRTVPSLAKLLIFYLQMCIKPKGLNRREW